VGFSICFAPLELLIYAFTYFIQGVALRYYMQPRWGKIAFQNVAPTALKVIARCSAPGKEKPTGGKPQGGEMNRFFKTSVLTHSIKTNAFDT